MSILGRVVVPHEIYCQMGFALESNSRTPATLLNLFQQHNHAIIRHIVDMEFVQSPLHLLETWPVACVKSFKRESNKKKSWCVLYKQCVHACECVLVVKHSMHKALPADRWFSYTQQLLPIHLKSLAEGKRRDWCWEEKIRRGALPGRKAPPGSSESYLCSSFRPHRPQSRRRRNRRCHFLSWCSRSDTGAHGRLTKALRGWGVGVKKRFAKIVNGRLGGKEHYFSNFWSYFFVGFFFSLSCLIMKKK